jgi:hypothetical protein
MERAEFKQISSDLFWRIFCPSCRTKGDFTTIRWTGYGDSYWWKKVAPMNNTQICPTCGAKIIDFVNGTVVMSDRTDEEEI